MLRTYLTEQWGLRYPIVGAPMVGATDGKAGSLGVDRPRAAGRCLVR